MKKTFLLCAATISMLLTSCVVSQEATTNQNQLQTQVLLNKKNYRVVREVAGESKQFYFLGIGGMSKKSLNQSAMSEMIKNANLQGSQAIINTNVQYKTGAFFIAGTRKAIARGTVIEFTEE